MSQETTKTATGYTEFHPRWYRERVSVYWWLGQWQYLKFILRELSSVPVAIFVVITLFQLRALISGPAAYARFEHWYCLIYWLPHQTTRCGWSYRLWWPGSF